MYFNVESEGSKNLYFTSTAGQFRPVTSGKQVLTVASINKSGVAAINNVGALVGGTMTAFLVSIVGTAAGVYAGIVIGRDHLGL